MGHAVASLVAPGGSSEPVMGAPVVEVSPSGTVAADLACRKCSSNLRGLSVIGKCRQCATRVGISLYGELLKYGHPRWVRGLSRGASVYCGAVLLGLAAAVAGEMVGGSPARWVGPAVAVVGAILFVRGAWTLTAHDPAKQVNIRSARFMARVAPCAAVAFAAAPLLKLAAASALGALPWLTPAILIAGAVGVFGQFLLITYVHGLALRVPSAKLARRTLIVRWGYCGALAMTTFGPMLPHAIAASRAAAYVTILALVALFVYSMILMVVLHRAHRAFAVQADFARGIAARSRSAIG
jgi:hypothetical protein